jgi:hypothetical protein
VETSHNNPNRLEEAESSVSLSAFAKSNLTHTPICV